MFFDDPQLNTSAQEFDMVLYERESARKAKPVLAIERNGREHYVKPETRTLDEKKRELCEKKGTKMIVIHNRDVMNYEYLSDMLLEVLNIPATSSS